MTINNDLLFYSFREAAIDSDFRSLVRILEDGFNINTKDYFGDTVLFDVVAHNNIESLVFLLKKGANPNIANLNGLYPFMGGTAEEDLESLKTLLEFGADFSKRTIQDKTALHLSSSKRGAEKVTEFFIECGLDINATCNQGNSALLYAGMNKDHNQIRYLLQQNANINHRNKNGKGILDYGSSKACLRVIQNHYNLLDNHNRSRLAL